MDTPSNIDDDALVSQITQQLKSQPVQASRDHANSIHEANGDGVKAYAKVAAQDWTFYITKLAINIGRAPEGGTSESGTGTRRTQRQRDEPTDRLDGSSPDGDDDEYNEEHIHIDLGPSKTVSREHAVISFESKNERWLLTVKGRNGVRVDGKALKPGDSHELASGEVLEIGNVEMMFVLPSEISPLHIHRTILDRCGMHATTPRARLSRQQSQAAPTSGAFGPPGTPPSSTKTRPAQERPDVISTPGPVMVGPNGVNLSEDENKHIKPQYSYAQMITQAITSVPEGKLTLNGIYTYIMDQYAYYRHQAPSGWQVSLDQIMSKSFEANRSFQNSIRHNLSLNRHFEKVARSTYEPGKGAKWQIVPDAKEELVQNAWRIGRGGHRGSSAPSSPNQLNYITQGPKEMAARGSPSNRKRRSSFLTSPPPRSSLPMSQSTPDGTLKQSTRTSATLTADGSPLPRSKKPVAADPSFSSFNPQSPTLTSTYLQDDGGSFVTPAPPRIHPRLAPPSTAQRPSQHMPTSSPAPFWRYADIGSTPLRPPRGGELGTSPTKAIATLPLPSSSPLRENRSPPSSPTRPQKEVPKENQEASVPESGRADKEAEETADEEQAFDLTKYVP